MILPREPQPGEKLNATWGRDVVKCLRQLRPVGGPGMKVTCGPNGSTFASTAKGVGGSTAVVSGDDDTLYPFRLGVGVEEISGSTGVRYHKVAITPAVDINGVGYEVLNEAVDDDAKLGGLPLPKTGSNLPWIWLKDASFNDVETEITGPIGSTTDVWLHIDKENESCVLSNSEADYDITGEEPFKTSEKFKVGKFDNPTGEPSVIGQYSLGSIIYKDNEKSSHPFRLHVEKNQQNEAIVLCSLPVYSVNGVLASVDNTEYGATGSEEYLPHIGATGNSTVIFSYSSTESGLPHIYLTDDTEAPDGYDPDSKTYIGSLVKASGEWTVAEQYMVGGVNEKIDIHPFKMMWVNDGTEQNPDWKLAVYAPEGAVQRGGYTSRVYNGCTARSEAGWYNVTIDSQVATSTIYLVLKYWGQKNDLTGEVTPLSISFLITNKRASTPTKPIDPTGYTLNTSQTFVYELTKIDTNDIIYSLVRNAISPEWDQFAPYGGGPTGGGGGTTVIINTSVDVASSNFITFSATGESSITFNKHDHIGATGILLSDGRTLLEDYLRGGATGVGTNLNTESYPDLILEQDESERTETMDLVGTSDYVSRADHKHMVDDILGEGDTAGELVSVFSNVESYNSLMRKIGVQTDPEETTVPEDDQTVTFGDITDGFEETMGANGIGQNDPLNNNPFSDSSYLSNLVYNESEIAANLTPSQQGEWDRDTDTNGKGFTYTVCCGLSHEGDIPYIVFRDITVDKYGMIRKISKAKYAAQYYM